MDETPVSELLFIFGADAGLFTPFPCSQAELKLPDSKPPFARPGTTVQVGAVDVVEVEDVLVANVDATELTSGTTDEDDCSATAVELAIIDDSIEDPTEGELELNTGISVDDTTDEGMEEAGSTMTVDESSGAAVELTNDDDSTEVATTDEASELEVGRSEEDARTEVKAELTSSKIDEAELSTTPVELANEDDSTEEATTEEAAELKTGSSEEDATTELNTELTSSMMDEAELSGASVEVATDDSSEDTSDGTTLELATNDEMIDDTSGSAEELATEDGSVVEITVTVLSYTDVDWIELNTSLLGTELEANVASELVNVDTSTTEVMTSMDVTEEAIEVTAADDSTVELVKSEIEAELT